MTLTSCSTIKFHSACRKICIYYSYVEYRSGKTIATTNWLCNRTESFFGIIVSIFSGSFNWYPLAFFVWSFWKYIDVCILIFYTSCWILSRSGSYFLYEKCNSFKTTLVTVLYSHGYHRRICYWSFNTTLVTVLYWMSTKFNPSTSVSIQLLLLFYSAQSLIYSFGGGVSIQLLLLFYQVKQNK